jgi:hypothetical protein
MRCTAITRAIENRKNLDNGTHAIGGEKWTLVKEMVSPRVPSYKLYHYSTLMLQWADHRTGPSVYRNSTGWGSVTDQQIMNAVFDAIGLDMYFSRKGGSHFVTLDHPDVPKYRRKSDHNA